MSRWWRAYDGAVDDPKLGALSDRQHRVWFNLCCICSQNGGRLPAAAAIAFKLRMTAARAKEFVAELAALQLVDVADDGTATMHNWSARQFQSDVSTERVKRFRKRPRNVSSAVSETPPDTEAETQTDTPSETTRVVSSGARKRASRLENDWWPTSKNIIYAQSKGLSPHRITVEAEKFRNHWIAKAGKDAAKLDWDATWKNWILRASEANGHHGTHRKTLVELGHELADEARKRELAAGIGRPPDPFGSD